MSTTQLTGLLMASRLPFLYPCAAVLTRRAMMSAFRTDAGLPARPVTAPNAPSTSASGSLNADAAAPQVVARPPALPKAEKARPKMRASKAALTITPRAVGRLQGLLKGPTPQLIRIGVRNKGCAGLSYHLEYVEEAGKFDEVVEQDGVRVVIDSKALFSIIGSEMDWTEDALSSKFSFKNPNITDACGCGESFTSGSCMDFFAVRRPCLPPVPAVPAFVPIAPAHLAAVLADPRTLVLDIRPHAAHADARLPRALSLSVPSTLLKRPLFSLDRLAEMLSSATARHRFAAFHDSARILVYDADSAAIPESSNIYGLLRKFRAAHFAGELSWLRGGFQAVWREQRHLIDSSQDHEDDDDTDDAGTRILCTRRLPMDAFDPASSVSASPFFDALQLSHGLTQRIPLCLPPRVRRRIPDLPLPWLRQIATRADRFPAPISSRLPGTDSDPPPSNADVDQGTEILAMQFHRIELAEQNRLMGIMDHHSKESRLPSTPSSNFPFSITAGVEKGAKNRYRNIWPFEHARVKLCHTGREGEDYELDDYVNASFVQPLGTTKKYIATQGPLEATFEDFWRLTWQQNVHVIVMLTQEVENSMVKCGTYWADTPAMRERTFGMLRVTLIAKTGLPGHVDLMHEDTASAKKRRRVTTIKRSFKLEHRGYPNAPSRHVVHLQYLEWPDMNVPDDARGVLELVDVVDEAVRETGEMCESPLVETREAGCGEVDPLTGVAWHVMGGRRPVLLHCSAGVGRTGCFIALDAVLDGIRREVRREKENGVDGKMSVVDVPDDMEVDGQWASGTVPSPMASSSSAVLGNTACVSSFSACDAEGKEHREGELVGSKVAAGPSLSSSSNSLLPSVGTNTNKDYVEPRALHQLPKTPVALSTFEEPIWEVVRDMREQRMSLCQSLRQYVFMHQAIIEGALRVVDQERERESVPGKGEDDIKLAVPSAPMGRSNTFPLQRPQLKSRQPLSLDLSDVRSLDSGNGNDAGSFAMKRGASPTELLKEGKRGELLLSKRPSVKRKIQDSKEAAPLDSVPRTVQ